MNGSFVLGFDHDRPDVFERTVDWIEANRLECATFHILTPYPGTPLFAQMEAEGRLLHHDWALYDTAHVVFRPRHMTPEELADGYAWCYRRLFSHRSIWRRRPRDCARCRRTWRCRTSTSGRTVLASSDRATTDGQGLAAAGGTDPAATPAIPHNWRSMQRRRREPLGTVVSPGV